mmetsp:Transcript_45497/g.75946  ORF Transcript_45497/g.75946 Transcript_45497/m.75946 type:complete len:893 (-) Transcript_45497:788-3466(-)
MSNLEMNTADKRENVLHSSHLWVGNVSERVSEDMLRETFAQYGDVVSVKILRQSRCAFVNFRSIEAATAAKTNLQGSFLGESQLSISWGQRRSRHLWVGNVGDDVTEDDLHKAFSPFGDILSIRLVRETKCCFVNFRDVESAVVARNALQRTVIPPGSSKIEINFGKRQDNLTSRHLWVGNLNDRVSEDELRIMFSPYGQVLSVRLLRETNCGFVNFRSTDEAITARQALQGKMMGGKPIEIDFKFPRHNQQDGPAPAGSASAIALASSSAATTRRNSPGDFTPQMSQMSQMPIHHLFPLPQQVPMPLPYSRYDHLPSPLPPPPSLMHGTGLPVSVPSWRFSQSYMSGPVPPPPAIGISSPGPPPASFLRPGPPPYRSPVQSPAPSVPSPIPSPISSHPNLMKTSSPSFDGAESESALLSPALTTDWTVRVKAWRYWCNLFHRSEADDALVSYAHADDCSSQPLTFVQLFLQSHALEGAVDSVMRMPPDSDADLLLCLFSYCLEGDDSVHRRLLDGLCSIANLLRQNGYSAFATAHPNSTSSISIAKVMRSTIASYKFDPMQVQKFAAYFSSQLEDLNRRLAETERKLQLLESSGVAGGLQQPGAPLDVEALLESTNLTAELIKLSKSKQQKMRTLLSRQTAFRHTREIHMHFAEIYGDLAVLMHGMPRHFKGPSAPSEYRASEGHPDENGHGHLSVEDSASPLSSRSPSPAGSDVYGGANAGGGVHSPVMRHILQRTRDFVDWANSTVAEVVERRAAQWDALMHSSQMQYLAYVERHMRQRFEQLKLFQRRLRFCKEKLESMERERQAMIEFGLADANDALSESETTLNALERRRDETLAKLHEIRTDLENTRFAVTVFLEASPQADKADLIARVNELTELAKGLSEYDDL